MSDKTLERYQGTLWAVVAAAGVALFALVWVYARQGGALVRYAASVEPEAVYAQGQGAERAFEGEAAVAHYRKALALGLDNPGVDYDCRRRLRGLLIELGRLPKEISPAYTILVNGSFEGGEDGSAGWIVEDRTGLAADSVEVIDGRQGLRLELAEGPELSRTLAVLAGERYRLSGWIRVESASAPFGVEAVFSEGAADAVGHWIEGSQDWRQWTVEWVTPESATAMTIRIGTKDSAQARGLAWVDGLLLDTGPKNLVRNPSFEQGDRRYWNGNTGETLMIQNETGDFVEGSRSVRYDVGGSQDFALWQNVSVQGGRRYRFEGSVKTAFDGVGKAILQVDALDRQNKRTRVGVSEPIGGGSAWTRSQVDVAMPADAVGAMLLLRVHNDSTGQPVHGRVWFDALRFEAIEEADS